MATAQFHKLKINAIRQPSPESTALQFEIPDNLTDEFKFIPGQYLTLRSTVDGEDIRRSYSICSARSDPHLEVGIKRVEGGRFSNFATSLKVGDVVQVMGPQGRFTAPVKRNNAKNYLLLAAGSGITPCLSIAKSVLEGEPDSTVTLVYGNQSTRSVMFLNDIINLKDRYTGRLRIFHALSREQSDLAFLNGRLSCSMVEHLFASNLIELAHIDAAYICGPLAMTEEIQATLLANGMTAEQVNVELFGTGLPAPRSAVPKAGTGAGAGEDSSIDVAVILDGRRNSLKMNPQAETVLAAAQNSGLDLPFSCAGGMCCTCRCKIVEGAADMDVNYSLQDWEIEAGFTLACQSRPTSKSIVLDFDAT